jgi:hypothetical protein
VELLPLKLANMRILGERGGQRLMDPAMVSLITELVAWNPHVDVSAMGVWVQNMYQMASEIHDGNIHDFLTEVFGGQHYYEGVIEAGKLLAAIKKLLAIRPAAMYAFGFLTKWNECKYLDKQIGSGSMIVELPLEDVGIAVGVGEGWQKRYPLRDGQTYKGWAKENMADILSQLTDEEIEHIPSVQLFRATLVAEHNDVSNTTHTSKHKITNTDQQTQTNKHKLTHTPSHTNSPIN